MQRSEILNKIRGVLLEINPTLTASQISEESSLVDFDLDSFKMVELELHFGEEFGVELTLNDWIEQEFRRESNAFSVSSLVTFIQQTVVN